MERTARWSPPVPKVAIDLGAGDEASWSAVSANRRRRRCRH